MRRPRGLPRRLLPCPHCGDLHRCLLSWPPPPPVPAECLCGVQVLRDFAGGLRDEEEGVPHRCQLGPVPFIRPVGLYSRRLMEMVRVELLKDIESGRLPRRAA